VTTKARDWEEFRHTKEEIYDVPDMDWRLRRIHRIVKIQGPDGKEFNAGASSALITGVSFTDERAKLSIEFRSPSPTAMLLDEAWRTAAQALELQVLVKPVQTAGRPGYRRFEIPIESSPALFDYFQKKLSSVLLAYAALEAFCNDVLAESMAPAEMLPDRKGSKANQLSSEELQRAASTEWKLGRLVPDMLGVPTPKGGQHWEAFVRLKQARDNVTHFKARRHRESLGTEDSTSILGVLYGVPCFEAAEDALGLIRYFYAGSESVPRWLLNPNWKKP
jgi:hypothetical protein